MELNELKSRLISIVSHELRTPLATIQLANEALTSYADRITDERKQEKRNQIKSAIQRMVFLLEDIVTLNRAESGKLKLEPIPFNLVSLCQTIIDNIRVSIRHNLIFMLSNDDACSEVCMDQRLVQLIVSNLLSNAAKYSPPGHTVYLDLKCEGDESVIQVRDEGIGIPPEEQKRLFEPFFRAGNVGAVTGTGLGLTIVKQAVEAHKGTITFESQGGIGTTFTLKIPNKVKGGCE
jgi:signal transduction histidine kinase